MKLSQAGLKLIQDWESLRLKSYKDSGGVWTLGWGHTGKDIKAGLTCTRQQADTWLYGDVAYAEQTINTLVHVPLSQEQFDALVSFVFNVGSAAFASSTMLRLLLQQDYKGAAAQFPRWNYDNGKQVPGLSNRRRAERAYFERSGLEIPSWVPQPPPQPLPSKSTTSWFSRLLSIFSGFFTSR